MDTPEGINKPDALQDDITTEPTEASLAAATDNNGTFVRSKLETILSDQAAANEVNSLQQELLNNDDYVELSATIAEKNSLAVEIESETDSLRRYNLAQKRSNLLNEIFKNPKYLDFSAVQNKIDNLTKSNFRNLQPDSEDAKSLLAAVSGAVSNDEQSRAAPFIGYKQNTSESWQYVPDQAVRDFLSKRLFVDTEDMDLEGASVRINKGQQNEPFSVDASLFVCAAGFETWRGRGDGPYDKKEWTSKYGSGGHNSTSLDTIKHYASLTTELPSVDHINIFVQPNGKMFANNGAGDSHRIAAAFLRGDKTIKADNVEFVKLDKDIL